ncbi:MAG: pyridoxine 5'-phosphate synthase [Ancalomicrobiaceae bacterium]|nr:pyridoxine 5'-phosphate synthase [Ancalomicrobiaceae bacterium]
MTAQSSPVLSVNLNAIAHLRNRRDLPWPSVTGLGRIALDAGANGLTVHPRPDERHIRRIDVFELRDLLRRDYPGREYNIEGFPTEAFLQLVEEAHPDQVTLVPDDPDQSTSDHGWDTEASHNVLAPIVERLRSQDIRVSIFIDAEPRLALAAARLGADRVELYTGPYGHTFAPPAKAATLDDLTATAQAARSVGLDVNIGHDLTLDNLPPLVARIPFVAEASIGHALVADALLLGMSEAVKRYCAALKPADDV